MYQVLLHDGVISYKISIMQLAISEPGPQGQASRQSAPSYGSRV